MPTATPVQQSSLRGAPDVPEVCEVIGADLLTPREVETALSVSPGTLTDYRTYKGLPYVRLRSGRKDMIKFRRAKVESWAKKHGLPFTPPPERN